MKSTRQEDWHGKGTRRSMTGQATWINHGATALHAWVHHPENGLSKGTVIIAPPMAREQVVSYRALRVLAMMLAEQGWVAVRFAWSGTGESGDLPATADLFEQWQGDLRAVIDFSAGFSGLGPTHGIGLRLGAAVLAAEETLPLDARLLWEPEGGRRFLRIHQALRRISLQDSPSLADDGVELGGLHLSPSQAASLKTIPRPTALPGLPLGAKIISEEDPLDAQLLFGVVSLHAKVPTKSLQQLIDLLPHTSGEHVVPAWEANTTALTINADGSTFIEEILEIGPDRIPAVYSQPDTANPPLVPTTAALFVAASSEPKDGATALWVHAARKLAAHGVPALRAERPGCGDLGERSALKDPNPYTQEIINGVAEAGQWLRKRSGLPVTGIGLCSGAWTLAEAAGDGGFERVVMINNVAWRNHLPYWRRTYQAIKSDNLQDDMSDPDDTFQEGSLSLKHSVKAFLRDKSPYWLWLAMSRRGWANAPEVVLDKASRTAEVIMHMGTDDLAQFNKNRGPSGLQRLTQRGRRIDIQAHQQMDHALLAETSRRITVQLILNQLAPTKATDVATTSPRREFSEPL